MGQNGRKFVVGFLALGVLVGVFVLYMRFHRTAPIVVDVTGPSASPISDANVAASPAQAGTIFDVGVGNVRRTEFVHRNEHNQIDRRFGFEELLHRQGDQWETTKPFMDLFFPEVACRVTAEEGRVQILTVGGRVMPTDAFFSGNVVIHIRPTDPNSSWESFIHLDDVGFRAEESLFSSTGAVRFLSRNVRLTGTGMELLYDMTLNRLELFRIFDLHSLRLRSSELQGVADLTGRDSSETESEAVSSIPPDVPTEPNAPPVDIYQCVFRRNVRLETPDGAVMARDVLSINNIFWTRPATPEPEDGRAADPNEPAPALSSPPSKLVTKASPHPAISAIPDELYDTVVTCDGGFEVVLLNASGQPVQPHQALSPDRPAVAVPERGPESDESHLETQIAATPVRREVVAQRIDFDMPTQDTTLLGPVEMAFPVDPNGFGEEKGGKAMPLFVTAQRDVRFLSASRQIVLDGGCTATLQRAEPNFVDEYRLTAPRMTLDLVVDPNATGGDARIDIGKFVADGGSASLRLLRRASDELLGGIWLEACELQYLADPGEVMAAGPGVIWLRNNETIRSREDPNTIDRAPFYARLGNFDTLQYSSSSNRIVAEDASQQLLLDYFPLIDGTYGPQTQIVAGHVEVTLQEVAGGRMDLASLVASKGIAYDNEATHLSFAGSELVYDPIQSLMTVRGDDVQPCYLNGVLVDQIIVDPRTGRVEAEVPAASVFQIGPP